MANLVHEVAKRLGLLDRKKKYRELLYMIELFGQEKINSSWETVLKEVLRNFSNGEISPDQCRHCMVDLALSCDRMGIIVTGFHDPEFIAWLEGKAKRKFHKDTVKDLNEKLWPLSVTRRTEEHAFCKQRPGITSGRAGGKIVTK